MSIRNSWILFLAAISLAAASLSAVQNTGRGAAQPVVGATSARDSSDAAFVRENYTKFEYLIAMRDGVKLFTSVYIPKEVFTEGKSYPILIQRTPYSVSPYGVDKYRANLGPSELFARERFIFAYQDVRGRYRSEGDFAIIRPHKPVKGPRDTDESTDCYDTVDWLIKNIPGNTGKAGMWGVSQPGFFAAAGMIDAHPALVAVSPQAPVTDYYMGDDSYHNGAFMLAHRFSFYQGFRPREGDPAPPPRILPFDYGTPDGYEFYLNMGSLADADEKYFNHRQVFWTQNIENASYNEFWQARSIWKHLQGIKPAVMIVGGWYDQEDPQGPLRQFEFMERHSPPRDLMLVMGPWNHGGFARGDGEKLGSVHFGSKTGVYYREEIEFPFFLYHLKSRGEGKLPKAWMFQTGMNQWLKLDSWPPGQTQPKSLYLDTGGKLAWQPPAVLAFDEYLADPNRPVPFVSAVTIRVPGDYMVSDQRFAATRPDVLVYRSAVLEQDVSVVGPISIDLKVSTTGTDSDFDVKLIDVYPGDYPDYNNPTVSTPGSSRGDAPAITQMGGFQQLIRGEPFRGKYRRSFEKPAPFEPGKPEHIQFRLPDVAHTFRPGHRIMIQVQSSWFPLTDRNPQKFMDISKARAADFQKATQRVYTGGSDGSRIQFLVMEGIGNTR